MLMSFARPSVRPERLGLWLSKYETFVKMDVHVAILELVIATTE